MSAARQRPRNGRPPPRRPVAYFAGEWERLAPRERRWVAGWRSPSWSVVAIAARDRTRHQQHRRARERERRHPRGARRDRQAPRRVPGSQGPQRRPGGAHRQRAAAAHRRSGDGGPRRERPDRRIERAPDRSGRAPIPAARRRPQAPRGGPAEPHEVPAARGDGTAARVLHPAVAQASLFDGERQAGRRAHRHGLRKGPRGQDQEEAGYSAARRNNPHGHHSRKAAPSSTRSASTSRSGCWCSSSRSSPGVSVGARQGGRHPDGGREQPRRRDRLGRAPPSGSAVVFRESAGADAPAPTRRRGRQADPVHHRHGAAFPIRPGRSSPGRTTSAWRWMRSVATSSSRKRGRPSEKKPFRIELAAARRAAWRTCPGSRRRSTCRSAGR